MIFKGAFQPKLLYDS